MGDLRSFLTARAEEQGFDAVGFAPVAVLGTQGAYFQRWLAEGRHAAMDWLAREPEKRSDPRRLLDEAQTVMVVGANYFSDAQPESEENRIARYARARDYHNVLPKRLRKVMRAAQALDPGLRFKVCVDTSPLMEKPWAQRAGLGWQGKHTNLVSRQFGSWLLLGAVLLHREVPFDEPQVDHCGSCTACLDACPTGALTPYELDANRCISYWTIEHRGPFPQGAPPLHDWVHGCDICLEACPWNRFERETEWEAFAPRRSALEKAMLETPETLVQILPGTPLARPGVRGLRRNAGLDGGDEPT